MSLLPADPNVPMFFSHLVLGLLNLAQLYCLGRISRKVTIIWRKNGAGRLEFHTASEPVKQEAEDEGGKDA